MKFIKPRDLQLDIPKEYRNYASFGPYNILIFGIMYFGRIKNIIDTFLKLNREYEKVLDIGGGFGLFSLNFKLNFPKSEVYILDEMVIEEITEFLTKNKMLRVKEYIQGDIQERTQFESEKFDVIFALDVLEHIHDSSTALDEIFRILKTNGILFISVPIEGKILRFIRNIVSKVKKIEVNPHWRGMIHSEKEFFNLLKEKKVRILSKRYYPFRNLPRMFSYDVFYLLQKPKK
ncbi:MAG: class I SAM-dependent methyltransferase [Candidatus Thorarchaeota archaeon]